MSDAGRWTGPSIATRTAPSWPGLSSQSAGGWRLVRIVTFPPPPSHHPLLLADASVTDHENTKDLYHLCGVFSVLSLLMVNTISNGHLQSDGGLYTDGILSGVAAKIWFFVGFLFGFG